MGAVSDEASAHLIRLEKRSKAEGEGVKLSQFLYRAARISRDVEAIERTAETGNPAYVARRVRNKLVGRALGRLGFWRRLWR